MLTQETTQTVQEVETLVDAQEQQQEPVKKERKQREKKQRRPFKAVLVNLDVELADTFHRIAKSRKSNATRTARELITRFVEENATLLTDE